MPIVITSPEGQQSFSSKADVKLEPTVVPAEPSEAPKVASTSRKSVSTSDADEAPAKVDKPAKDAETDADEDDGAEPRDTSFDYLDESEEASADEHGDEDEQEDDDEPAADAPKRSGFKKRIDTLTKRNTEYENRIAQLEARLNGKDLEPRGKDERQEPTAAPAKDLPEPQPEQFDDYGDYVKASVDYRFNEEKKARAAREYEEEVNREAEKITKEWQARTAAAEKRYGSEKWNAIKKADLPLTTYMRAELMQSDIGPDMLYWLYKNPAETKRIAELVGTAQIKELTKLEIRVKNKLGTAKPEDREQKPVSKAAEPIKPISSKTTGRVAKDPSKMSLSEYRAWRESGGGKR